MNSGAKRRSFLMGRQYSAGAVTMSRRAVMGCAEPCVRMTDRPDASHM